MFTVKPTDFFLTIERFVSLIVAFTLVVLLAASQLTYGVEVDVEIPIALDSKQEVKFFSIRVVNEAGEPVAGVKVKPWALRSSQGHGSWNKKMQGKDQLAPQEVITEVDGTADVAYPYYRNASEKIKTLEVSLRVDHPDYAFRTVHIDVTSQEETHELVLERGALVLIKPLLDGELAPLDDLYVTTSGNRGWLSGSSREVNEEGLLRLPVLETGKVAIRVVRIIDEQATHFGPLLVLNLKKNETALRTVELQPAVTIKGQLTSDIPLPFNKGRVKYWTLLPERGFPDATWFGWAPVNIEGEFSFVWPANESLQIIALTEDMIATPGEAPKVVEKAPNPDPYERPHVFVPEQLMETIKIPMRSLVPCEVLVVNDEGNLLEGIRVNACPNVQWWNSGSQIYCDFCVRPESTLSSNETNYWDDFKPVAEFSQVTNAKGKATLMLPEGSEAIHAGSKEYEMPIAIGRRSVQVKLTTGETTKVKIVMQPRGQELLGDWDKLVGVVFGCSTREGKRICALPGVKEKIAKFRDLLNEAKDPRDPEILVEAYSFIVEVLSKAGDSDEAAKWQRKVDEQKSLIKN